MYKKYLEEKNNREKNGKKVEVKEEEILRKPGENCKV